MLSLVNERWISSREEPDAASVSADTTASFSLRVVTAVGPVPGSSTADIVISVTNTGSVPLEVISAFVIATDPLSMLCAVPSAVACLETYLFPLRLLPLEELFLSFALDPSLSATTLPTPDPMQSPEISRAFATHVLPVSQTNYRHFEARLGQGAQTAPAADQLDAQLRVGPSHQSIRGLTLLQSLQRLRAVVTTRSSPAPARAAVSLFGAARAQPPPVTRTRSVPVSIGAHDLDMQSAPLSLAALPQRFAEPPAQSGAGAKPNPLFCAQTHTENNLPELELFAQTALEVQALNTLSANRRLALVAVDTPDASVLVLTPRQVSPDLGPGEPFVFTIAVVGTRQTQNGLLQTLQTRVVEKSTDQLGEALYELSGVRFVVR